ncbi:MAG: PD40 domain-containing protein, partial [Bacteroidales bacterium]|nr:PD40 domain-containing protein [Bacteroidales bacterium]
KPEVVIIPADGGETRHYMIPTSEYWAPGLHDLRWLPDNSGVGFSTHSSMGKSIVHHLDLATGQWQDWTLPIEVWTRTDWGPDENSFVYAKWKEVDSDVEVPDPGLYQFNIITGETQNILQPEGETWYLIKGLKFSRDHKKLTFMLNNTNLMVVDLGSGESRMLAQKCWSPTFSPDGQKILTFGRFGNKKNGPTGVTVFSLDGEILHQYNLAQQFTAGTKIYGTDWSPDGKHLVF